MKEMTAEELYDMGWKNFMQAENGLVYINKGKSFEMSDYIYASVPISHRKQKNYGYINLKKRFHSGYQFSYNENLRPTVEGVSYHFFNLDEFYKIFFKKIKNNKKNDSKIRNFIETKILRDNQNSMSKEEIAIVRSKWKLIQIGLEVGLVGRKSKEDEPTVVLDSPDDPEKESLYRSVFKAGDFIELDASSFVDMDEVDKLESLRRLEKEKRNPNKIKRTDIAKLLGIDKNTLYKLNAEIKNNEAHQKAKDKLNNYIDLYLYKKYLA